MSSGNPTVPLWFHTEFVNGVTHAFQNKGHVFGKFTRKKNITGNSKASFKRVGTLQAVRKVNGKIGRQNAVRSTVEVSTEKWFTLVEIDQFELDQLDVDDRDVYKTAGAMALARKSDDIFIEAINLSAETALGGTGDFMSPDMSQQISERFVDQYVMPENEVVVALSARAWRYMMRFKEFSSSDYNGPDLPWAKGNRSMARTWDGKHWFVHPRLPKTGNIRKCFAWTPMAMGEVTVGDSLRVIWSWENGDDAWLGNMNFAQGNKILEPTGIIPIEIDESVDPIAIDPDTYAVA